MRYDDSATHSERVPVRPLGGLWAAARDTLIGRAARRAAGGLRKAWQDQRYAQERLQELRCPWELEGPLRWQGGLDGPRLVGTDLPGDSARG